MVEHRRPQVGYAADDGTAQEGGAHAVWFGPIVGVLRRNAGRTEARQDGPEYRPYKL